MDNKTGITNTYPLDSDYRVDGTITFELQPEPGGQTLPQPITLSFTENGVNYYPFGKKYH